MVEAVSLAARTKLAYGVGAAAESGLAIVFNTFNFLFYNNVLGLSGTLCGLAVTIAMVFDAISDPLVGSLSDRWRSPLGRRHPFLYAAPIPMGFFFVCIYAPPSGLEDFGLFAWFTVSTVLLRTALTLYHVPHLALGAEITVDYRERSVLMGYNTVFALLGTSAISYLSWSYLGSLEGGTSNRLGYFSLAMAVGLFGVVVVFASAFFTRDQVPRLSTAPVDLPPFSFRSLLSEVRFCLRNRNYQMLILGMIWLSATLGLHETLSAHIGLFFWELDEQQIGLMALMAPPGLIAATMMAPRLHVWIGKREALILGILGMTSAVAVPVVLRLIDVFPANDASQTFPILCGLKMLSYAASALMVISIISSLADVTDEHELQTGRRQEGVFFAARSFFSKLTSGLGHLLAGLAIDVIRFPVGAEPGGIDSEILFDFGIVAGPLTVLPALISIAFYARYRIDRRRHAEIRALLDERRVDPIAT